MAKKPLRLRDSAGRDVDQAIEYYLRHAGDDVALAFVDALEDVYRHIATHPRAGSNRYSQELDLPGLRHWRMRRYPYLIFYVEREDHMDVWRVLHGERDIPASMHPEPDTDDGR